METKQIVKITEALIDALTATCSLYGSNILKRLFIITFATSFFLINCFAQNEAQDSVILKAVKGDAEAQFKLACYYFWGKAGIPKDQSQAVYWFRKAAEQGHNIAQFNLGSCYKNGDGVIKDQSQAVYWYHEAAKHGLIEALNKLGYCYLIGDGTPKDYFQAVRYFREAAEQGMKDAQHNLGHCYENGYGVSKDLDKAVYWYRKAAEQGLKEAQNKLDKIVSSVPKDIKKKLCKSLKKYIESESDQTSISLLFDDIYKKHGLYLGSVFVQHEINVRFFLAFISKNMDLLINNNIAPIYGKIIKNFGPNFFKTLDKELEKKIYLLVRIHYGGEINFSLLVNHIADEKETFNLICDYMKSSQFFPESSLVNILEEFERALDKESSISEQDSAYRLALLMYTMDKYLFNLVLQVYDVFSEEQFTDGSKTMQQYFDSLMEEINPIK